MPTAPSLALLKALEILADGEWHDYQKTVRKIARTVPPGQAMRETERMRISRTSVAATLEERVVQRDPQRLIEIGANAMARNVLCNTTRFEIYPRGVRYLPPGVKRVRLKPPPSDQRRPYTT